MIRPQIRARRPHEAIAEYIVDITTQADRAGKASQFGDLYDSSELKAANDRDLESEALLSQKTLQRTQSVRVALMRLFGRV